MTSTFTGRSRRSTLRKVSDDPPRRQSFIRMHDWTTCTTNYLNTLQAAGRSPLTIRLHRHYLSSLAQRVPRPGDVSEDDLVTMLTSPSWGAESRKSARTVYRGFFGWAHRRGLTASNPAAELPTVRVSPGVPRPAPEDIVAELVGCADERLALMGMLAAHCGLRAGEIAQLHADDFDGYWLTVHGKGGKDRLLPIVDAPLAARLSTLRGWAFPGRREGHLSSGHVTRLLSRGLPGVWTAHTLRHRAGTVAYRGTRDIFAVSRMLGHSRTETTQRYVLMDDAPLVAAMQAAA